MRYRNLLALIAVVMLVGVVSADTAIFYTTNATDGCIARAAFNSTYINLRNGAGTSYSPSYPYIQVSVSDDLQTNTWRANYFGILIFDTSVLPDISSVSSAIIGLRGSSSGLTQLGDVGIGITNFSINGTISIDDYTRRGFDRYAADKLKSTLLSGALNNWSLNAIGIENISKTGNTGYSIMTAWDIDNTTPGWVSGVIVETGNRTLYRPHHAESVLYPPVLEVTFIVPPVASFTSNVTGGVDPTAVQFNDTSTNTPTSWSWARKNLTATTWAQFSTVQNATQTFVTGNWSVNLTATNSAGSGISASAWINVSSGVPAPTPTPYPIIFPWCGIQNMFFWNESSDIPGYYVMNHIPQLAKANVTGILVKASDGSKYFMTFITPAGMPNVSQIAPGMFKFQTYHNVSSADGVSTVEFQFWNRSSDGTETNLFYGQAISKNLDETSTVMMEYLTPYARRNYTTLFPGDRLMIKLNVSTTSVPEKLVEIGLGGNALASRAEAGWFMCEDPLVALNAHVSPTAGPWMPVINPPTDLIDSDWWKWLSGYWWIVVGGILAILWLGRK